MKGKLLIALCVMAFSSVIFAEEDATPTLAPVEDYSTSEITSESPAIGADSDSLLIQSTAPAQSQSPQSVNSSKDVSSAPAPFQETNLSITPSASQAVQPNAVVEPDLSSLPLDQRVKRLEQQMANANQMNLQGRLEDLQQQVQKLSGDLEVTQHNLKELEDSTHSLYQDLDQRLNKGKADSTLPKAVKPATKDNDKGEATGAANATAKTTFGGAESQDAVLQEQQLYQSAFDLLQAKKFADGGKKLQAYLDAYPDGIYAANAHYWLGQVNFSEQHYSLAATEFNTVINKYPESPKVPEAMLQLGLSYDKEGKTNQAQDEFRLLKKKFPKSSAAKLADAQLKM